MLITNFLGYKHWSPCWVYIIHILTPLVKPFHLDIINLAKHNEEDKQYKNISIVNEMKSKNKRLRKI